MKIQTARMIPCDSLPILTGAMVMAGPANEAPRKIGMHSSIVFIAALSFAAMAPVATGCASQYEEAEGGQGSIVLPLVQTAPDGDVYQLTNASFEIIGPGSSQIVDGSYLGETLNVTLPPGLTTIMLLDGWTLMRTPATGSIAEPVSAQLGTSNPFVLRVLANHTTTVSFGFIVRSIYGQAEITFGVTDEPRELAGGVTIHDATGEFAPYMESSASRRADFAFFFQLRHLDSVILPDGTKERVYFAGIDDYEPTPIIADFFNDAVGTLSGIVGPGLVGGYLEYHLGAKPDGSIELYGTFVGVTVPFTTIDFGPYTLRASVPLDADGFPADVFFHDAYVPFTMVTSFDSGDATMSGLLNLRHIP
jgi:hypothetical protein